MQISRNALGQLRYEDVQGQVHEPVMPVRAFPFTSPTHGISLVDALGHEQLWVADLALLEASTRNLIEIELAEREFMPIIEEIVHVSSYSTPSRWQVKTNRGATSLLLKGEEDIRRLSRGRLIITADNGLQFLIESIDQIDKVSRHKLERFL